MNIDFKSNSRFTIVKVEVKNISLQILSLEQRLQWRLNGKELNNMT